MKILGKCYPEEITPLVQHGLFHICLEDMQEIGRKENCKMCQFQGSLKPINVRIEKMKKKRLKVENPLDPRQRKKVPAKTRKNLSINGIYKIFHVVNFPL